MKGLLAIAMLAGAFVAGTWWALEARHVARPEPGAPDDRGRTTHAGLADREPSREDGEVALPAAVLRGCELADTIASATPGASVTRETGSFHDEVFPGPVPGCRLAVAGSFAVAPAGQDATERLRDGFAARGWRAVVAWSADGKDGSAFAYRHEGVVCVFRARWDGGSDGEPPIPRGDAYRVSVLCTSGDPAPTPS